MKKLFIKKSNFREIIKYTVKHLSVIHNYHSPYIIWLNGKFVMFDDKLEEYNQYIQAFLTKRFTHKKEVPPKIQVLNVKNSNDDILKYYHNTFYIQKTFPLYNLLDYSYLKYMDNHKIIDTGYILSRFCEEYEKNIFDAAFDKIILCGRVEFMEDQDYFRSVRTEVDKLIDKFYNGDKLTKFEREIERAYLAIKENKFYEEVSKYRNNPKRKIGECFLTFSEKNKLSGHINFRMKHPNYFFQPCPIFESIDIQRMFDTLYEIRYNSLKYFQIFSKLKLKFQYRKSLLQKSKHRIEFVASYIYRQIYQYLDCYEFNNEFKLSLNFRINFNLIVFHCWLIINRLQKIANIDISNKIFCEFIIQELIEKISNNFKENLDKFQFSQNILPQILHIKNFIKKLLDHYTWHFEVLHSNNSLENIRNLLKETIFNLNTISNNDKNLMQFSYYAYIHYEYFSTKFYKDIESCNFNFSINRIPININNFVENHDTFSQINYTYNLYSDIKDEKSIEGFINKYKTLSHLFLNKYNYNRVKKDLKTFDVHFKFLNDIYGINPYDDAGNYVHIDPSKGLLAKFDNFMNSNLSIEKAYELEKLRYEEEMSKPINSGTVWDINHKDLERKQENEEEEQIMSLQYLDKIKQKRDLYLQKIKEK